MPRGLVVGMLALPLLIGCDPTEADCRRLVAEVNASVDRLRPQRVADAGPPEEVAASMRRFGAAVADEANELAALGLEAPPLVAERDAYVDAARRTSTAATGWADAIDARRRARQNGDAARRALDGHLDELEERCDKSTCFELMQRLAALTKASESNLPKELDALGDDLGEITTDDPAIDAVVARQRAEIQRLARALLAMRAADTDAERHREILERAAASESSVVDRINGICRP